MTTAKTSNATYKARQEVSAAIEAILSARAQIEQTRAAGMYSEEYLAQKRGEIVSGAQSKATEHLEKASQRSSCAYSPTTRKTGSSLTSG